MNMKMLRLAALMATAWLVSTPLWAEVDEKRPETGISTPAPTSPAREKKRDTYPFNGTIALVDVTARTVTLKGRENKRVISLTEQTRLVKQGQPAAFEDLKAGERIGGTLRKNAAGREEALLVRIGPKSDPATGVGAGTTPAKGEANVAGAP